MKLLSRRSPISRAALAFVFCLLFLGAVGVVATGWVNHWQEAWHQRVRARYLERAAQAVNSFHAPLQDIGFDEVKSVPAGLLIASSGGLHRGDASLTPIRPAIGGIFGIALSQDRLEIAATGAGRMLRSHDGGVSFATAQLPSLERWFAAAFADHDLFVFSERGKGFAFRADGSTQELSMPGPATAKQAISDVARSSTWYAAAFRDRLHGFVAGDPEMLVSTSDGGLTWTRHQAPTGPQGIALFGSSLFITGSSGISRSDDDGQTFAPVFTGHRCERIDAREGMIAAACTGTAPDYADSFVESTDGRNFAPARSQYAPFPMAVAVEPGGRLAGVNANPALYEGPPEEMKLVYESRIAQWQRLAKKNAFPSLREGRGSNLPAYQPLSEAEQKILLEGSLGNPPAKGFSGAPWQVAEGIYDSSGIDVYINSGKRLENVCTGATSVRACFDELAAKSATRWSYDGALDVWELQPEPAAP